MPELIFLSDDAITTGFFNLKNLNIYFRSSIFTWLNEVKLSLTMNNEQLRLVS
jgi:hypothetical protein